MTGNAGAKNGGCTWENEKVESGESMSLGTVKGRGITKITDETKLCGLSKIDVQNGFLTYASLWGRPETILFLGMARRLTF